MKIRSENQRRHAAQHAFAPGGALWTGSAFARGIASVIGIVVVSAPLLAEPLLRENWTERERARIDGLVSRFTGELESPADRYQLPDDAGRHFYIDDRGGLHFEPLYDGGGFHWRPVVPDVRDAALYFVEADALYRRGLKDEAFYLMKALRAMRIVADTSDASAPLKASLRSAVVREGDRATRWLNAKERGDSDFARLDRLTDPFAVYNGEAGWTMVFSDRFGWRLRLPGSWRFQRGQDRFSRSGDPNRNAVYLRHNEWRLMIASDVYVPTPARLLNIEAFIREWDLRRSLTPARKRLLAFRRETLADDLAACAAPPSAAGGASANSDEAAAFRSRRDQCALFQTGLRDSARSYSFREYFRLFAREGRGFFLQFSYELPDSREGAELQERLVSAALTKIAASLRFSNR